MRYTFQESRIWESGDPVDSNGKVHRTKARSLDRAKKKLPPCRSGRVWVLIKTEEK